MLSYCTIFEFVIAGPVWWTKLDKSFGKLFFWHW